MKQLLLLTALFLTSAAFAQKRRTTNVPLLANPNIVANENEAADANQLYKGQTVRFAFTVLNPSQSDAVKAESCFLQIELSDKLQMIKNITTKNSLENYFRWSTTTDEKGKVLLLGKLVADLPADFTGSTFIELRCMETGTSSIHAQWLDAGKVIQGALSTLDFTVKKLNVKTHAH